MAHITKPRVGESCTTTGTGTITLGGALTAHQSLSAVMAVGDTAFFDMAAVDVNGAETGEWEEFLGTYGLGGTLARTTVLNSSTGSAVSFSAGTKFVRLVAEPRQISAVPRGGTTGQAPLKQSGTDYDVAWGDVQAVLVSGTNIKSINGASVLGSGDLTVGGANPGGSGTEPQYRVDATTLGGMAGVAWDNTNRAETRTGATVTASNPVQSFTQIWNNAAVAFKFWLANVTDTASNVNSNLAELQVGGSPKFTVRKDGRFASSGGHAAGASMVGTDFYGFNVYSGGNGVACVSIGENYAKLNQSGNFSCGSTNDATGAQDIYLGRDASGRWKMTSNGTALADLALRNLLGTGARASGTVAKTTSFTAALNEHGYECDATAGAIVSTLPALSTVTAGQEFVAIKTDSSGNSVTFDGNASETIDGATTISTSTQYGKLRIKANAAKTAWYTF